ncbi:uncharacterized protein [Euphorbia lathyris]|uniref:uncharacterized protein isoform X2 n=1 Tax=Euphorbia lathyris TaxID=212925 RepID=UPI0033135D3D
MASKLGNNLIRNVFSQIHNRFLQSSATLSSTSPLPNSVTSSSSFTVQFLVNSCGLPLKSALSVSEKFQLEETNPQKPQSVLQLLKWHHFSDTQVAKLIVKYPQILHIKVKNNLQPKLEYFVQNGFAVNAVKNLGLEPNAPMFVHALRVMISMRASTWEKKIGFMKSMGWKEEEILMAFKRYPYCLAFSEAKIRKALHFYLNIMKLQPKSVVANPVLLGLSIEKRIRPRFNVLNILQSKKLIEINKKDFKKDFMISEKDFKQKYVDEYIPKAPGLLEMYLGSKESKKIDP